jgi:peptide/nickel transport system substrate-binding protein
VTMLAGAFWRKLKAAFIAGALLVPVGMPASTYAAALKIAVQENPPVLDPVMVTKNVAYRVLPNVFETLIQVDYQHQQKLVPGLATEWKFLDPRTIEFKLRQNVKFHDGSDFTAQDVVFSLGKDRLGAGKPGHGAYLAFLSTIEAVDAVDDHTVRIRTVTPDPVIELRLSGWGSQIVSKRAFEAVDRDWGRWSARPIGTGPFRVADFVPSEKLILKSFDAYWRSRPAVDEVGFYVVPEPSTRVAGLLSGGYDIIGEVTPDQIDQIEGQKGFKAVGGTIRNHRVVSFDFDNKLLQDLRVRKALSLAIDRKLLVDTLWKGRVEIGNGLQWPEYGPLYDASRPTPAFDPQKAKELLAQAGYKGQRIPYRIRNNYYPAEIAESQALVAMWKAVGLNIDLQIKESWEQVYAEPGTGLFNSSSPPLFADPVSGLWRNFGAGGGSEGNNWNNARFKELGKILVTSTNVEERAKANKEMLDIWDDIDPPSMILHTMGQFYGIRAGITWTPYNVAFMDLGATNLSLSADR